MKSRLNFLKKNIDTCGSTIIDLVQSHKIASVYIKGLYKEEEMTETKPIVSVENVVASASVDQKIDLNEITKRFPETEYHPDQFPGLYLDCKVLVLQH